MNKKTLYTVLISATLSMGLSSCSDWLDVRGENIEKEQDMFAEYKGFTSAMVGAYMDMASRDIYGEQLTMTYIESIANLWNYSNYGSEQYPTLRYFLATHQYDKDEPKEVFKSIYAKLFNVVTSANVMLHNAEEKAGSFPSERQRAVIMGECYAMRAYCQLDILRLFGQMPKNAQKQVKLPYSETYNIEQMPAYYDYASYVAKLKADIEKAESLLKDNDPIFDYTFNELNSATCDDDSWNYRQSRLNYWAVRALHARMLMYLGEKSEAAKIAREIIAAKGADGNTLIELSGASDLAKKYYGLPSECLFYISKYDLNTYANNNLVGGNSEYISSYGRNFFLSLNNIAELYASLPNATASHNRYINTWNKEAADNSNRKIATLKKYWYDEKTATAGTNNTSNTSVLVTKLQIIPMIRLSEMYLIAIEGASNVDEANKYYDTYMKSCAMPLHPEFASMEEANAEILNEYRREFFGEGQMFFTYKRLGETSILWNKDVMNEDSYIVPLPATEYDPSNINK